jgi:AmiR/NasT family two-component response regulator
MHLASTLTVLIAEDNLIPALEIEDIIRELGCDVVGPVGKLSELMKLIDTMQFDAALLDVELKNGEKVFPAADLLRTRGVPFAFFTAYDREVLGPKYATEIVVEKPFLRAELEKCVMDWMRAKKAESGRLLAKGA